MAKLDKRKYTKQQWHIIREQRRFDKLQQKHKKLSQTDTTKRNNQIAFVLGNGLSRQGIDCQELSKIGKIIGINMVDHIIIGGNSFFSFADEGLL